MHITETESGHVIKPPDFKCDHPLGKNVKDPVPNNAFFWALIGSAGSGKTYQLTNRYIRLLLDGESPDRILATTFTRKAAQEMTDRLHEWLRVLALIALHVVGALYHQFVVKDKLINRMM